LTGVERRKYLADLKDKKAAGSYTTSDLAGVILQKGGKKERSSFKG